jgi:hypothetical protein
MRTLIILFFISLISCKEKTIIIAPDLSYVYYKVKQINYDGEINYTETKLVRNLTMSPPYSEDTCNSNCPVPLMITKFDAYCTPNNYVRLDWICENEDGINYYAVCKSKNNKEWLEFRVNKLLGKYTYIDKK